MIRLIKGLIDFQNILGISTSYQTSDKVETITVKAHIEVLHLLGAWIVEGMPRIGWNQNSFSGFHLNFPVPHNIYTVSFAEERVAP